VLGPFDRKHARHAKERRLGDAVGRALRRAGKRMRRGDVDDGAAAASRDQRAADRLSEKKRAADVDAHHRVPFARRHLGSELAQIGAGIVDQHVDAAQGGERLLAHARHARFAAEIEC